MAPEYSQSTLAAMSLTMFCLIVWYRSRGPPLDHIPSMGPTAPVAAYISAIYFLFNAPAVVQKGYERYKGSLFKIPRLNYWEVMASGYESLEDIRKASDDVLSLDGALREILQTKYTLGSNIADDPYHIPIIQSQLTKSIPGFCGDIHDEIVAACTEAIPCVGHEWVAVKSFQTVVEIMCRTINRVFVGLPLCRDNDYRALISKFTVDVVKCAYIIRICPDFLKPLVGRLVTTVPSAVLRASKHLGPLIEERINTSDSTDAVKTDLLTWLIEGSQDDERSIEMLSRRVLAVNFAAIHTSSMIFTHALHRLAAHPEFAQALREEVEPVTAEFGWSKTALDKMKRVDSFLREVLRVDGLGMIALPRRALKPFTFSNGMSIPPGTTVSCCMRSTHFDEEYYDDPNTFNPFRFSDPPSNGANTSKQGHKQMVLTGADFLSFGHGRHACPGRFFASAVLKMLLTHVVTTYDVKFEGEKVPRQFFINGVLLPGRGNVMFRKRSAST